MQRRAFLKKLAGGSIGVALVSTCGPLCSSWCTEHVAEVPLELKSYAEYTSFSKFATQAELDDVVMQAAEELGRAAGAHLSWLSSREGLEAAGW